MGATAKIKSIPLYVGNVYRQIQFTREKSCHPNLIKLKIFYFGIAGKSFKERFFNHNNSFNHEINANNTEQLEEYRESKITSFALKVSRNIVRKWQPYKLRKKDGSIKNERLIYTRKAI